LKARGYRIVHVVPATAERPATPSEPQQWQLHPPSEAIAISHWPKIPNFVFADAESLPAPSWSDMDWRDERPMTLAESMERVRAVARGVPLPREAPWPRQFSLPPEATVNALPVPAESNFDIPEKSYAAIAPASHRPAARETDRNARVADADSGESRRTNLRKHFGRVRRASVSHMAGRRGQPAAHASRRELKHLVLVKKRHV
jgi:peptidoglycan-N-acetylglucosamine deacetylase